MKEVLLTLSSNPYRDYSGFQRELAGLIQAGSLPSRFVHYVSTLSDVDGWDEPFVFIEGIPLDDCLPVFDNTDPVNEKRASKRTFVIESYLEAYAQLSGIPPISFRDVNDGDVFHDVYPREDLYYTQSQKALGPLYFHRDLASDRIAPEYVNLLAVRSAEPNQIYNTFVRNKDVVGMLDESTISALSAPEYQTVLCDPGMPAYVTGSDLENTRRHAILEEDGRGLFFFEKRTVGLTADAKDAVAQLTDILHLCKKQVLMRPGDFVSMCNHRSLHGKEVLSIVDPVAARRRWLMKTVNARASPGVDACRAGGQQCHGTRQA